MAVISAIILSGLVLGNITGLIEPQLVSKNTGIFITCVLVFSVLMYGFWIGNHVKCPECGAQCERYSDGLNKSRKVLCQKCRIVWDLGISYNLDS